MPHAGSQQLHDALTAAGVSSTCRMVPGKTHTSFLLEVRQWWEGREGGRGCYCSCTEPSVCNPHVMFISFPLLCASSVSAASIPAYIAHGRAAAVSLLMQLWVGDESSLCAAGLNHAAPFSASGIPLAQPPSYCSSAVWPTCACVLCTLLAVPFSHLCTALMLHPSHPQTLKTQYFATRAGPHDGRARHADGAGAAGGARALQGQHHPAPAPLRSALPRSAVPPGRLDLPLLSALATPCPFSCVPGQPACYAGLQCSTKRGKGDCSKGWDGTAPILTGQLNGSHLLCIFDLVCFYVWLDDLVGVVSAWSNAVICGDTRQSSCCGAALHAMPMQRCTLLLCV